MDGHHEIVMKARAEAGSGTQKYFAYSTILDQAAFEAWRSQHGYDFFSLPEGQLAEARDVKLVFDFPSRFWGGRVAGLTDAPGATVHGKLFEIAAQDWPIIQHKEGAVTGMCVEKTLKVQCGGTQVDAVAFVTNPSRQRTDGPVSAEFVQALLRGAASAGLPEGWRDSIVAAAKG